jgi:hypothetical protein
VNCSLPSKIFANAGPTSISIDVPELLDVSAATPGVSESITIFGPFRTSMKNLIQSIGYETLHSVQSDTFRTFARAS